MSDLGRTRRVVVTRSSNNGPTYRTTTRELIPSHRTTTTTRDLVPQSQTKPKEFGEMQHGMEDEMERRRSDWEKEVSVMQEDFFNIKTVDKEPTEKPSTRSVQLKTTTNEMRRNGDDEPVVNTIIGKCDRSGKDIFNISHAKSLYSQLPHGGQLFKVSFDIHGFQPDDVQIQTEGSRLTVKAKHVDDGFGGGSNTRQFNRQVEIPSNVDPDKITSYLSDDGILIIEAPVEEGEAESSARYVQRSLLDSPVRVDPPKYKALMEGSPTSSSASTEVATGSSAEPQILDGEYGKRLKLVVELGRHYDADDITISLIQWRISIRAKHEEMVGGRTSSRNYSRSFEMPERVENRTVIAKLTGNGRLVIGGSLRANRSHEMVMDAVEQDMPLGGQAVKTTVEDLPGV